MAFDSWAGNLAPGVSVSNSGVFVRDVLGGTTTLASSAGGEPPNGKSYLATISGDGGFVAFWSQASNLVPGDTNGEEDLFAYDRVGKTLTQPQPSPRERVPRARGGFRGITLVERRRLCLRATRGIRPP